MFLQNPFSIFFGIGHQYGRPGKRDVFVGDQGPFQLICPDDLPGRIFYNYCKISCTWEGKSHGLMKNHLSHRYRSFSSLSDWVNFFLDIYVLLFAGYKRGNSIWSLRPSWGVCHYFFFHPWYWLYQRFPMLYLVSIFLLSLSDLCFQIPTTATTTSESESALYNWAA